MKIIKLLLSLCFIHGFHSSGNHINPLLRSDPFIQESYPIRDSNLSFLQAISGSDAPKEIIDQLKLINIKHIGYDSLVHIGQMVVNTKVQMEVVRIFDKLYKNGFPIEKMIPISAYDWSDDSSMKDNNTSGFSYRVVKGSRSLSMHAFGLAIDINPRNNPFIQGDRIEPANGVYDASIKGTITEGSEIVNIFKSEGWLWGGDWKSKKDYQHFYRYLDVNRTRIQLVLK